MPISESWATPFVPKTLLRCKWRTCRRHKKTKTVVLFCFKLVRVNKAELIVSCRYRSVADNDPLGNAAWEQTSGKMIVWCDWCPVDFCWSPSWLQLYTLTRHCPCSLTGCSFLTLHMRFAALLYGFSAVKKQTNKKKKYCPLKRIALLFWSKCPLTFPFSCLQCFTRYINVTILIH